MINDLMTIKCILFQENKLCEMQYIGEGRGNLHLNRGIIADFSARSRLAIERIHLTPVDHNISAHARSARR